MSDSVQPHRRQPTRLPHPWDSPGKNTGVGCHFLLQWMKVKSESEVAQLCLTLRDPMTVAYQAPLSMGFPRQEYWSGLPLLLRRNTCSNRQIWPWNMEWSRAKANRVLPRECTGHSKHPLPTTQEKTLHMDITRWSTPKPDGLYSLQPKMEKLYTVSKNKTGSWLWLRSWTPYCQIQT